MIRLLPLLIVTAALALYASAAPASAAYESLLAPESACPGQSDTRRTVDEQRRTMLCLVNYARTRSGVPVLAKSAPLMRAAARKAQDIVRCEDFSHTACGSPFDQRIRETGYVYSTAGENIAWGSGSYGSPRQTMLGWLNSTGHRANLLSRAFRDQGVGMVKATFEGWTGAEIWVDDFATRMG